MLDCSLSLCLAANVPQAKRLLALSAVTAGERAAETDDHAERSVQTVAGHSDEGPVSVPAFLHPLLQTQRQQAIHGKSSNHQFL